MRTIENAHTGRRRVVAEMRELLARPYRDFIAWGSLYDVTDAEERERRREQVSRSLDDLSKQYLPRSMWFEPETRKKIEAFVERAGILLDELASDVRTIGYPRARVDIARRVTRELGPLRREVEAGLVVELARPEKSRWRERLRRLSGR